jgi:hypothetical protein
MLLKILEIVEFFLYRVYNYLNKDRLDKFIKISRRIKIIDIKKLK